jgi:hypothetical protein
MWAASGLRPLLPADAALALFDLDLMADASNTNTVSGLVVRKILGKLSLHPFCPVKKVVARHHKK